MNEIDRTELRPFQPYKAEGGQIWSANGLLYMVCQVSNDKYNLMSFTDGNRYFSIPVTIGHLEQCLKSNGWTRMMGRMIIKTL